MTTPEIADVCVLACAEAFRGDGDRVVSPMGTIPRIGALLAKATFEPDILLTDGEARILRDAVPLGAEGDAVTEGWLPFRDVFQVLNAGRRHVMMGASQLDRHGNQNISAIGDWKQPTVQLLGSRGAPGNTINHTTSYWIAGQSPRVFVDHVDFVSGIGTDRAAGVGARATDHELRAVVTDLAVLDLRGPDGRMRIVSTHPGVSVDDVQAASAFELAVADEVATTPAPTAEQQDLIDRFDPRGARYREVPRREADA